MPDESGAPAPSCIRTRQDFGRELTKLREQAGLTVRQVASKAGPLSAHSTIGDWFAGRSLPSPTSRDSFQAEDADWFFGRQVLTTQLLGHLAELDRSGGACNW